MQTVKLEPPAFAAGDASAAGLLHTDVVPADMSLRAQLTGRIVIAGPHASQTPSEPGWASHRNGLYGRRVCRSHLTVLERRIGDRRLRASQRRLRGRNVPLRYLDAPGATPANLYASDRWVLGDD